MKIKAARQLRTNKGREVRCSVRVVPCAFGLRRRAVLVAATGDRGVLRTLTSRAPRQVKVLSVQSPLPLFAFFSFGHVVCTAGDSRLYLEVRT